MMKDYYDYAPSEFEKKFPVSEFIEFLDGKYRVKASLIYDPATRILAELKQAQWEGWKGAISQYQKNREWKSTQIIGGEK